MPEQLPTTTYRKGAEDIDERFSFSRDWTLVAIRCHFAADPDYAGTPSSDPVVLTVSLDCGMGEEYDSTLYKFSKDSGVGIGADAQMVMTLEEIAKISPWTFPNIDSLRVSWTNPGGVRWGLQVSTVSL